MTKNEKISAIVACVMGVSAQGMLNDVADAAPKKGEKTVECFGANECKGKGGCASGKDHVEAANKVFAGKFKVTKGHDCAGNNDCSAAKGNLAWISKANKDECFASGGFLITKDADGKLKVEKKGA